MGVTLGTPIALRVNNEDQRPHDYSETDLYPRPSHADYTYLEKYAIKASSGGGRSSARETIGSSTLFLARIMYSRRWPGRVAAGAIAEKYLKLAYSIEIVAFVSSVGKIHIPFTSAAQSLDEEDDNAEDALSKEFLELLSTVKRSDVDQQITRCPHPATAEKMTKASLLIRCNHNLICSLEDSEGQGGTGLDRRDCHLRRPKRPRWSWGTRL